MEIEDASYERSLLSKGRPLTLAQKSQRLYTQWRTAEMVAAVLSMVGVATSTVDYELGFAQDRTYSNCAENINEVYRWLTLVFTLLSMVFLVMRHQTKREWYKCRPNPFPKESEQEPQEHRKRIKKERKLLSLGLVLELLGLCIFPYPYMHANISIRQEFRTNDVDGRSHYVHVCYRLAEFFYVLMFLRLGFLLRSLFNLTIYQNDHARVYCTRNGTKANVRFSVRCMIKTHPLRLILGFIVPSFLLFGIFLRVFERPYTDISGLDFESYLNSVWCCAVTMATIGYGDLYPGTHFGRIVAILCALWGAFTFSMVVFTLESSLQLNISQNKAFKAIHRSRSAALVVVEAFRLHLLKKKYGDSSLGVSKQKQVLEKAIKYYKSTKKSLKIHRNRREQEMQASKHYFKKVSNQMKRIETKLDKLLM